MPSNHNPTLQQQQDEPNSQEVEKGLMTLGRISIGFSRVRRRPRYPDGEYESDVEHSFMLGLAATELAATYYPELDNRLVTQFTLVHDLPEYYAGDTPTLNITDAARIDKEKSEKEALEKLLTELPSFTAQLLERYERQEEPEARFVRLIDKLMPALTIAIAGFNDVINSEYGITDAVHLQEVRSREAERLQTLFPEFPIIHSLRANIINSIDS